MMTSDEIRDKFLRFFESKGHKIVPSAPLVVKDDPTLMFTNAGMNQFKDIFLGNTAPGSRRVADTQKCLRVSGKHNDLEEVGVDTYHHTMFEMLGNWSFGDYFKQDAIAWAWELLTDVYGISPERLYVTVFEGSEADKLGFDEESRKIWAERIAPERILAGSKKDNFWEMGETGPCGPCTEIHADIRSEADRKKEDGKLLVNQGHPEVIEIWNLVFMEFNRLADGSLQKLPARHVDTGMGFERLCMVLQGKSSTYDTDVFREYIRHLEDLSSVKYTAADDQAAIAMRVIADHIRAVSFAIADGQLPASTGAGYVIRRILRRAVRYGYSFLGLRQPFLHLLSHRVAEKTGSVFPNLKQQIQLVSRVIEEEEQSFLRTLEKGIQRFQDYLKTRPLKIDGGFAFELYDTYGFPVDLTSLMAREHNLELDQQGFDAELAQQKERSRQATKTEGGDWQIVKEVDEVLFTGYDELCSEAAIIRYREIKAKGKKQYQLVLDRTPFYAEAGGQVGDRGTLSWESGMLQITDTKKENNLIVHFSDSLPPDPSVQFKACVDTEARLLTERNHSATHLLHAALRQVLGNHVEQKGSLVNESYLRFDFSHFARLSDEEIARVESLVNEKIWQDVERIEERNTSPAEAKKRGAMALFGEKYGDRVRVITFGPDYSVELCGGTHVRSTGSIGLFVIKAESAVAAGVRRIEALTSRGAYQYLKGQQQQLESVGQLLKSKDPLKAADQLLKENDQLSRERESQMREHLQVEAEELGKKIAAESSLNTICHLTRLNDAGMIRDLAFRFKSENNLVLLIGGRSAGKAVLSLLISENLINEKKWNASAIIRQLAAEIKGGGGGQPFYATAGGSDPSGIERAFSKLSQILK